MRSFIKYLASVTVPTIFFGLLLYLVFLGDLLKIVDVVSTKLEYMFSFIQNENIRNIVIIVFMFLVYEELKWIFFKFTTRKSDE